MNGNEFKQSETDQIFGMVKIDEKVRITMGQNVISQKKFDTFEEAENYIASKPYELIYNGIFILQNYANETKKKSTKKSTKNVKRIKLFLKQVYKKLHKYEKTIEKFGLLQLY